MSMPPNEKPGEPGIFLMRRRGWFQRAVGKVPAKPISGDRSVVRNALLDLIDAAGGLEFSREELLRVIKIDQEEYLAGRRAWGQQSGQPAIDGWGGNTVPAVYYAFFEAVTWTRTIKDRFENLLKAAIQPHDQALGATLEKIRDDLAVHLLEDARKLAKISLHYYTPPYAGAGAKVEEEKLIYPVPDEFVDKQDFSKNLKFDNGRHAQMIVEEYWKAICIFIDRVLDEFYPK